MQKQTRCYPLQVMTSPLMNGTAKHSAIDT